MLNVGTGLTVGTLDCAERIVYRSRGPNPGRVDGGHIEWTV